MASPIFGLQSKFGDTMTIRFNIPGMTCGGCARSITKAIQGIDTAAKVETDISERRSEEHTSELQSLMRISYAVFCLKKKKATIQQVLHINNQQYNNCII